MRSTRFSFLQKIKMSFLNIILLAATLLCFLETPMMQKFVMTSSNVQLILTLLKLQLAYHQVKVFNFKLTLMQFWLRVQPFALPIVIQETTSKKMFKLIQKLSLININFHLKYKKWKIMTTRGLSATPVCQFEKTLLFVL